MRKSNSIQINHYSLNKIDVIFKFSKWQIKKRLFIAIGALLGYDLKAQGAIWK